MQGVDRALRQAESMCKGPDVGFCVRYSGMARRPVEGSTGRWWGRVDAGQGQGGSGLGFLISLLSLKQGEDPFSRHV